MRDATEQSHHTAMGALAKAVTHLERAMDALREEDSYRHKKRIFSIGSLLDDLRGDYHGIGQLINRDCGD